MPTKQANLETSHFIKGLYTEFLSQQTRYAGLTAKLLEMEAQVELAEKNLRLTRDHFTMVIQNTPDAGSLPPDWAETFNAVEWVGRRLADACAEILRAQSKATTDQLVVALNNGMFRFRTSVPAREVNAALLRQKHIKKEDEAWVWKGPKGGERQARLRLVKGDEETTKGGDEAKKAG